MAEKNTPKKPTEITSNVTPILITGNDRLAPYIQIFSHQPENISQHALGTIFGIFKIDDISVDSAFIVNFLVSELKKEYYGNPRRTPAGSFEAGLNRINIALSELAKQGNIAWIGKLESAICALEKNGMMHFSVTGASHIALLREGSLSLISDGLAPDEDSPNPLKTFIEISSGKLHPEDLVVLGSHELFEFLPREKMEKSARRFTYDEFTRFLHTALVNEFDFCGAVTIALCKQTLSKAPKQRAHVATVSPEKIPNMWGSNSFHKRSRTEEAHTPIENPEDDESELQQAQEGHLYIQQSPDTINASRQEFKEALLIFKERLANTFDESAVTLKSTIRQWKNTLLKKISKTKNETGEIPTPEVIPPSQPTPIPAEKVSTRDILTDSNLIDTKTKSALPSVPSKPPLPKWRAGSESSANVSAPRLAPADLPLDTNTAPMLKLERPEQELPEAIPANAKKEEFARALTAFKQAIRDMQIPQRVANIVTRALFHLQSIFRTLVRISKRFTSLAIPFLARYFRTAGKSFFSLPRRLQIGAFSALILALVIFIWILFPQEKNEPANVSEETPQQESLPPTREAMFAEEKNTTFPKQEDLTTLYSSQNSIRGTFVISTDTLAVLEEKSIILLPLGSPMSAFPIPEENGLAISGTYMTDLSLLFVLTDKGSILSFSPVSKKFSANNLTLDSAVPGKTLLASYLTYLYVADTETNTILRYPRAEGGFGSPSTWLSESSGVSLAGATHMTIDGSLYLSKPDTILRLSNKKEDPLTLEKTSVLAEPGSVTTRSAEDSLLVADTKNNRALFFKKEGSLEKQVIFPEQTPTAQTLVLPNDNILILQTTNEILRLGE